MNSVKVNGKAFQVSGSNVSIVDGKVYVDGKEICDSSKEPETIVTVEGDVQNLRGVEGDVVIKGNVTGIVEAGGSVSCGDIGGHVDAGGSVNCKNINGDVDAGGSVNCQRVEGKVDAGGSVMIG